MYVNATEKEEDDCVANIAVAFATAKKTRMVWLLDGEKV